MKKFLEILQNICYCVKTSMRVSLRLTIFKFLLNGVSGYLTVFTTIVLSKIINSLTKTGEVTYRYILFLLGILGVGYCLIEVGQCLRQYVNYLYSTKMEIYLKEKVLIKSCDLDVYLFDSPEFYDNLEMIKGAHSYVSGSVESVFSIVNAVLNFVLSFWLVTQRSLLYSIIIIVGIVPLIFLENRNIQISYQYRKNNMINVRKQNYFFYLATERSNALEIRLFDIANYLKTKFLEFSKKRLDSEKYIRKYEHFSALITEVLKQVVVIVLLGSVAFKIFAGQGEIGDFTVCLGLFGQLQENAENLIMSFGNSVECNVYVKMLIDFLKSKNKIFSKTNIMLDKIDKIEFRNVTFRYNESEKNVLENVSFQIMKNDYVALIGVNGAGKSTIIKLLLRYYEPVSGEIFVNDRPIVDYQISSLRKQFSVCFQNINAYGFSIRENILMAGGFEENQHEEIDERIQKILDEVGLLNVNGFDRNKLDTYITKYFDESGIELSGGQYQRLALARSFYRNGSIMVLDEPSAALDPEAEDQAFSIMERASRGKICLFISHRLANIHNATKIILLEDGKVLGIGTHKEMMEKVERYRKIYLIQANKYDKD